jgi:hypothetical protein
MQIKATYLRSDVFEVRVTAIKFLEWSIHLLAWLRVVVPSRTFHPYILKHVLMSVCFREVPFLQRIFLPVFLNQSQEHSTTRHDVIDAT